MSNGTNGRVYGGDPELVHVHDGRRASMGKRAAMLLSDAIRKDAMEKSYPERWLQPLCPGCYMIVGYNALITLATHNNQDMRELGRSMAALFTKLADTGDPQLIEEMQVIPEPPLIRFRHGDWLSQAI